MARPCRRSITIGLSVSDISGTRLRRLLTPADGYLYTLSSLSRFTARSIIKIVGIITFIQTLTVDSKSIKFEWKSTWNESIAIRFELISMMYFQFSWIHFQNFKFISVIIRLKYQDLALLLLFRHYQLTWNQSNLNVNPHEMNQSPFKIIGFDLNSFLWFIIINSFFRIFSP